MSKLGPAAQIKTADPHSNVRRIGLAWLLRRKQKKG
jgi:hypothetical protein